MRSTCVQQDKSQMVEHYLFNFFIFLYLYCYFLHRLFKHISTYRLIFHMAYYYV